MLDRAAPRSRARARGLPRPRPVASLAVALLLVGVAVLPAHGDTGVRQGPGGAAGGWDRLGPPLAPIYRPPAQGPVRRGFEPAATAFGPGHRGVDLEVPAGTSVVAAADGTVHHAGMVAGTAWVSVAHADGVLTSYGPLEDIEVARGDRLAAGTPVGVLAAGGHGEGHRDQGLHWGARRDGRYLDPLTLLTAGVHRPSLVGAGWWDLADPVVDPYTPWDGARFGGLLVASSPVADRAGYAVPPNGNRLVLLAGLGTSSRAGVLDPHHLGYADAAVTRFRYAGGTGGAPEAYEPRHTWAGVPAAAADLEVQLRALAVAEPGRPVDLVGHSMGGVVALYYLTHLHDPRDRGLPAIGAVVTLGSPLEGSDVAQVGVDLAATPVLGSVVAAGQAARAARGDDLGRRLARIPLDAPALRQLATGSDAVAELTRAAADAVHAGADGPYAHGTRVLTVGGSRDVAVAADRARLREVDGALAPPEDHAHPGPVVQHRVLPGGHEALLHTEAVRQVVYDFLADEQVPASPGLVSSATGRRLGDTATGLSGAVRELGQGRGPFGPRQPGDPAEVPPSCASSDAAAAQPWCG